MIGVEELLAGVAGDDNELARLREQLEAVALRRARRIADYASAPGMSVRRAGDALGISPTAVQKAIDRARSAAS